MTREEAKDRLGSPFHEGVKKKTLLLSGVGALVGAVISYPTKKQGAIYGALLVAVVVLIDAKIKYESRVDEIVKLHELAAQNTDPNISMPVGVPVRV